MDTPAASPTNQRPPTRRRGAFLVMFIPVIIFLGYWGYLNVRAIAERSQQTQSAAPGEGEPVHLAAPAGMEELRQALAGKPLPAQQEQLWEFINETQDPAARQTALGLLGEVQLDLLYSTQEGPGKRGHLVEAGQSLALIAQKYGSTTAAIVRANNLFGTTVQPGQHLVIPELGSLQIHIFPAAKQAVLYWQGRYLKGYPISLDTPAGAAGLEGQGLVAERLALKEGAVVEYGDPAYYEAAKVARLSWGDAALASPGAILNGPAIYTATPEDMEEIFPLLTAGTQVIIKP